MGSEGHPAVTIHVTGFKKFHGVSENPTETIVSNLKAYMKKKGLPKGVILGSCCILETAGQGALYTLNQTLQNAIDTKGGESLTSGRVIWLHFGVNSGATRFAIEHQAVNEATFRCPDEMGWKPLKVPIVPSDGPISRVRETTLPVEEIAKALTKKGFEVMTSDDAGRFVCNYVYYHSLHFAEQNGTKSLFVHVPLFLTIDEETQMQFAASLLEIYSCSIEEISENLVGTEIVIIDFSNAGTELAAACRRVLMPDLFFQQFPVRRAPTVSGYEHNFGNLSEGDMRDP